MTKSETHAYLAGFFDGEGYVGIYMTNYRKEYFALRVIVGQKDTKVLSLYKKLWGGSLYERFDKRNGREHYAWEIRGRLASKFLDDISPYVIQKKAQVKLAKKFVTIGRLGQILTPEARAMKVDIRNKISALNSPMGFGAIKEIKT